MLRWIISLLIIVLILTLIFQYSSFITDNSVKRREDSVSLAEIGKMIKGIRQMNKDRKEDIKRNEEQFGGDE